MIYGSNYFESMGLTYLGPIDGNDYFAVEELLGEAKKLGESVVIHLKTVKGKGYPPAEQAPDVFHGMSPSAQEKRRQFSTHMGKTLADLADSDPDIVAITAAMCDGTGLKAFRERHKDRFFDVGIAEGHALTFAAGLAAAGKKPVAAIYSTFLQRGYDNIVHDIALQKLPVVMCIDRAGLNGADGATHHGIFDVSFLSAIPNLTIYTPISYKTLEKSLVQAIRSGVPSAIRYPSGCEMPEVVERFYAGGDEAELGIRTDFLPSDNPDILIVTHGRIVREAMAAAEFLAGKSVKTGIILLEMLKPYDRTASLVAEALPRALRRNFP
jgi:1-deoxy-D-xylulose-5-phosphate synthase